MSERVDRAQKRRGESVAARMQRTISERGLADSDAPVLLMVSGGSDSTALAYLARDLRRAGALGPLAMLHVNHCLRGAAADEDARFVQQLADALGIPLTLRVIDVAAAAARAGENVEAAGRRVRYRAASEALADLCRRASSPLASGRIFTAHTADDRVENFYMRSIVGTGPGGFRSMRYQNGPVARPLLDLGREELRGYLRDRAQSDAPIVHDAAGNLWREDATNAHTDRFRAYVRHELVPVAHARNPQLNETLCRTMNLIADEDDLLEKMAADLLARHAVWEGEPARSCVLAPALGAEPLPLMRRAIVKTLQRLLPSDARIESATVDAILAAWERKGSPDARPIGGYVTNVQGNLAVSANKHGVRIEPMETFRARRKRA